MKQARLRKFLEVSYTHSWSWALLEEPPIVQLLKSFPAFYGTRRFITVFTRALHWSLSRYYHRKTEENHLNLTEDRNEYLANTSLDHYFHLQGRRIRQVTCKVKNRALTRIETTRRGIPWDGGDAHDYLGVYTVLSCGLWRCQTS
jgi:hypothetical protein